MAKTKTTSKSKTANKSRVNKKVTKKPVSKLLIGGILVGIIAIVGIVVVYTSQAAAVKNVVDVYRIQTSVFADGANCIKTSRGGGYYNTYCRYGNYPNGTARWKREQLDNNPGDYKCVIIFERKTNTGSTKSYNAYGPLLNDWKPVLTNNNIQNRGDLRFAFTDSCD